VRVIGRLHAGNSRVSARRAGAVVVGVTLGPGGGGGRRAGRCVQFPGSHTGGGSTSHGRRRRQRRWLSARGVTLRFRTGGLRGRSRMTTTSMSPRLDAAPRRVDRSDSRAAKPLTLKRLSPPVERSYGTDWLRHFGSPQSGGGSCHLRHRRVGYVNLSWPRWDGLNRPCLEASRARRPVVRQADRRGEHFAVVEDTRGSADDGGAVRRSRRDYLDFVVVGAALGVKLAPVLGGANMPAGYVPVLVLDWPIGFPAGRRTTASALGMSRSPAARGRTARGAGRGPRADRGKAGRAAPRHDRALGPAFWL
jgi:hypothetical protein